MGNKYRIVSSREKGNRLMGLACAHWVCDVSGLQRIDLSLDKIALAEHDVVKTTLGKVFPGAEAEGIADNIVKVDCRDFYTLVRNYPDAEFRCRMVDDWDLDEDIPIIRVEAVAIVREEG